MVTVAKPRLPLLRGTVEGANCCECPFSINGRAARPVCSEHPEKPAWILVGEGPGCFPAGTGVMTPTGMVAIEMLREGDSVIAGDGSVTSVRKTFERQAHGLIKIEVVGGVSVTTTLNHPIFAHRLTSSGHARRRIEHGDWVAAEDITTEHALFFPFPTLATKPDYFELSPFNNPNRRGFVSDFVPDHLQLTPDLAFALGLYIGDGSSDSGTATWHLSTGYKEKHVARLMGIIRTHFRVEPKVHRREKLIRVQAHATKLERWFKAAFGARANEKRVPPEILGANATIKSEFLYGWHEADGKHLARLTKPRAIATVSKRAVDAALVMFLSMGTFPIIRSEAPRGKGKQICYSIGINNSDVRRLQWPLPTHDLKSRQLHTETSNGFIVPVRAVHHIDWTGTVYNIETITNDYTVPFKVHNSTEVNINRPFVGPSGQVVDKILAKIGRPRNEIFVGNATLCQPPRGSPDHLRDLAAKACKPRLQRELAQWPGVPIMTLGAVAARALIPQETLDAIDPPTIPKSKRRSQKERQRAEARALAKETRLRVKSIEKIAKRRLKEKIAYRKDQLIVEKTRPLPAEPHRKRKRPTAQQLNRLLEEQHEIPKLKLAVDQEAIAEYELGAKERELQAQYKAAHPKPGKPSKPKKVKITDIMGTCFDVDVDGTGARPLIPALHPAALLRGGGATIGGTHTPDLAFINLIWDAGKVNALAQGHDVRLRINIETEITDEERTWQLLRDVVYEGIAEGALALDLETYVDDPERHHALMAYVAKIKAIGLATKQRAVSVLWDKIPSWAQAFVAVALAHPTTVKIFHNGLYDRTVLMANGFAIDGPWDDTLLAHHASFPGCAHRLQVVASQFFATAPWKSEFRNAEETPEGLTVYNAKDTGATHALLPQLQFWVKKTKTEKIYALDKKMAEIASKMHLAGMPVSRSENSELLKTFSKNIADSRRAVEAIVDDPKLHDKLIHYLALQQSQKRRKNDSEVLNDRYLKRLEEIKFDTKWKWKIGSGKHIAALLQALGVRLHQVTATGQISTKKEILESLADVPIVRDILAFRENDKLFSTFVWPTFDRFDSSGNQIHYGYADGNDRIHPIWVVHKITGRWASSEQVVSNVPKEKFKKLADGTKQSVRPNLRRQVVAPRNRLFVGFDFGQLEARVIALISGDPFLCQVFAEGRDIHTECARVVFPSFDKLEKYEQKQARDVTKNFEYGSFYGGSIDTLWKTILKAGHNIKQVDVAKAVALLMHRMPGVVAWQRNSVAEACQPPYEIRDFLYGRRRTFPLGQVEATEAMNFGVQAAGASIMNTGMANADVGLMEYKEAFAIAQIHDAAVFECWEDDAPKLAEDVRCWFEQSYERDGRTIPFSVEVKIGKSWADV